ncbi:hypothetical protein ZIOFF_025397 [Zingiber officinale]|uniref:Uncharacterized protein n=1 Tax=Zingiber officinale TaxID=94328 RepID=A0A8J5HAW2_ZINOF|nr:hypothetical protein ZIOFF_025397 [Zingiber officinale]
MFFPHSSSSPADLTVTAISSSLLTSDTADAALTFLKPQPSTAVEGAAGYSQSPPPFPLSRALVSYCSRTAAIADHAGTTRLPPPPRARASPSVHSDPKRKVHKSVKGVLKLEVEKVHTSLVDVDNISDGGSIIIDSMMMVIVLLKLL